MKQDFFRRILNNLYDGVYFVDKDRRISFWNTGACRLSGYSAKEVIGSRCMDNILVHVNDKGLGLCRKHCPLAAALCDGKRREAEIYLKHKEGHRVPVLVRIEPVREGKKIVGAVEIFSDNSARLMDRQRVEELTRQALIDPLTQIGNRRFMEIQINLKIEEMKRYGHGFGLLFIDIDKFKQVNDVFGHETGDRALRMVAQTLQGLVKGSDVVGRWGGEEFLVILGNIKKNALAKVAERFRNFVARSVLMYGKDVIPITASIGGTYSRKKDAAGSMIKRADNLMYKCKKAGRNCCKIR